MFGVVVITHGDLGRELLKIASHILGDKIGPVRALSIPFMDEELRAVMPATDTPFEERRRLAGREMAAAIEMVDQGSGVLIMTDTVGGTAFNVARSLVTSSGRRAVILAGVNLPMLLKLPSLYSTPLEDAAPELVERTRKAIMAVR